MSTATIVLREQLPPADAAQWWRMAFRTDEQVIMDDGDPEQQPTVVTFTFPDGLEDQIAPSSVRHRAPTTRLPEGGLDNWTGEGSTRRVDSLPEFFDVLMVGRPTNSPRWIELTAPGIHRHPDSHL